MVAGDENLISSGNAARRSVIGQGSRRRLERPDTDRRRPRRTLEGEIGKTTSLAARRMRQAISIFSMARARLFLNDRPGFLAGFGIAATRLSIGCRWRATLDRHDDISV